MDIYKELGWNPRDAAQRIVQKNIFGLDIDKRAYQLAYFAVMMKARQYDWRFLTRGIKSNVYEVQASGWGLAGNIPLIWGISCCLKSTKRP